MKTENIHSKLRTNGKWQRKSIIIILVVVALTFVMSFALASIRTTGQFHVLYSLEDRNIDKSLIKIIDQANSYVYFAIYFFTKSSIADALVRAQNRGVNVIGIMDRDASQNSNLKIRDKLNEAGIRILTQRHPDGIMHIKALVTENAYASGSYNWTESATNVNDEVLEIGSIESVRKQYLAIIKKLIVKNQ